VNKLNDLLTRAYPRAPVAEEGISGDSPLTVVIICRFSRVRVSRSCVLKKNNEQVGYAEEGDSERLGVRQKGAEDVESVRSSLGREAGGLGCEHCGA
jgi:hypothetical protein